VLDSEPGDKDMKNLIVTALLALTLSEGVPLASAQSQDARFVNVATSRRTYRSRRYRNGVVVRRRSKAKSAAIVGGSAAGGAAIGALAGGGKGAAIGAIAGGGAGLVYDRKTHKKVVHE
jgi:uncharacterized protein YcfJ